MRLTRLQLYAITELIAELENILLTDNNEPCSFSFVSCKVVQQENSNPVQSTKVLIVFYNTVDNFEYNYVVFEDGVSLLLPF